MSKKVQQLLDWINSKADLKLSQKALLAILEKIFWKIFLTFMALPRIICCAKFGKNFH